MTLFRFTRHSQEMINIAATMDSVRAELGVVYPHDAKKPAPVEASA